MIEDNMKISKFKYYLNYLQLSAYTDGPTTRKIVIVFTIQSGLPVYLSILSHM